MNDSMWAFECAFGLKQEDCGEYTPDEKARGHGRWDGCPSCIFRRAANDATAQAEDAWECRWLLEPEAPAGLSMSIV